MTTQIEIQGSPRFRLSCPCAYVEKTSVDLRLVSFKYAQKRYRENCSDHSVILFDFLWKPDCSGFREAPIETKKPTLANEDVRLPRSSIAGWKLTQCQICPKFDVQIPRWSFFASRVVDLVFFVQTTAAIYLTLIRGLYELSITHSSIIPQFDATW